MNQNNKIPGGRFKFDRITSIGRRGTFVRRHFWVIGRDDRFRGNRRRLQILLCLLHLCQSINHRFGLAVVLIRTAGKDAD